jgi:hypothetical protein
MFPPAGRKSAPIRTGFAHAAVPDAPVAGRAEAPVPATGCPARTRKTGLRKAAFFY